jgi:hypothetical protein
VCFFFKEVAAEKKREMIFTSIGRLSVRVSLKMYMCSYSRKVESIHLEYYRQYNIFLHFHLATYSI